MTYMRTSPLGSNPNYVFQPQIDSAKHCTISLTKQCSTIVGTSRKLILLATAPSSFCAAFGGFLQRSSTPILIGSIGNDY